MHTDFGRFWQLLSCRTSQLLYPRIDLKTVAACDELIKGVFYRFWIDVFIYKSKISNDILSHLNVLQLFKMTVQACLIFLSFYFTAEYANITLTCCFWPLFLSARCPAGYRSSKKIHLKYVSQSQFKREKNHLLSLHLCHRHRQHSICLPCGEGPHLARKPRGVQLGLKLWCCCCNSIGLYSCQSGELCSDSVCLTLLLNTII